MTRLHPAEVAHATEAPAVRPRYLGRTPTALQTEACAIMRSALDEAQLTPVDLATALDVSTPRARAKLDPAALLAPFTLSDLLVLSVRAPNAYRAAVAALVARRELPGETLERAALDLESARGALLSLLRARR